MNLHIENIAKKNREELRQIQKDHNLKNFRVLIAPNVASSVDECIAGALQLLKGTVVEHGELVGDLDAETV